MVRFLSAAWFDEIDSAGHNPLRLDATGDQRHDLVLHQVVTGTPDGDVDYFVTIQSGRARVERQPEAGHPVPEADVTITSDWPTATAIAQGRLSTQKALMQGRLRVRGDVARLVGRTAQLVGLDAVPASVRENTTY